MRRITTAINTLDLINIDKAAPYESHRKAVSSATERLRAYRDMLARQQFSNEDLMKYFNCKESSKETCKVSKSYKEIEAWLTDTLL